MGLVNVYPDSADVANNTPRKFLVHNNLAYWDSSLANMDSLLDANKVNGLTNWRSQMIIMNSRTDSMFKQMGRFNTTAYRYLRTDTWKNQMPHFTDPKDLFTTQLALLKTFALGAVDTGWNGPPFGTYLPGVWSILVPTNLSIPTSQFRLIFRILMLICCKVHKVLMVLNSRLVT